jgi:hypothetical protein
LESGNAEPPWFAGAMDRILTETLAPIRADIQDMKNDIQDMKNDIQDMKRVQGQVWKLAARVSNVSPLILPLLTNDSKSHNFSGGAGDNAKLEIVPFTNGRDPTKDPVISFCLSSTCAMS